MIQLLLGFLNSNPLRVLKIAGITLVGLLIGWLLIEHDVLEHRIALKDTEIASITYQKEALARSVDSLNLEISLAKESRAALEEALVSQQARADRSAELQKEIENATSSDDGPVSSVLRRTIERLQ
jgi:hypothetical protein